MDRAALQTRQEVPLSFRTTLLGAALALLPGCGDLAAGELAATGKEYCDAASLSGALSQARPGDVVTVGKCEVSGSFEVPEGVTLTGLGQEESSILGDAASAAVKLAPGAVLSSLTIHSQAVAGVLATGAGTGNVTVHQVSVDAKLGIGLGAERLEQLLLTDVTLTGQVTPDTRGSFSVELTPAEATTHGLVLVDVAKADLTHVATNGWSGFGALLVGSGAAWTGGNASDNLGAGVVAIDGALVLDGVEISRTMKDKSGLPAFGALLASGALMTGQPPEGPTGVDATLTGVSVLDGEGIGVMYAGGSLLDATDVTATGNQFVGLMAVESSGITLTRGQYGGTRKVALPIGEAGADLEAGDGIQLLRSQEISFTDVTIAGNERGGLLVDIGELEVAAAGMSWANVAVSNNPAFGAICQGMVNGAMEVWGPGQAGGYVWDEGILRDSNSSSIDEGFMSPLVVLGVIDPNDMPSPVGVIEQGLSGLIGQ